MCLFLLKEKPEHITERVWHNLCGAIVCAKAPKAESTVQHSVARIRVIKNSIS